VSENIIDVLDIPDMSNYFRGDGIN